MTPSCSAMMPSSIRFLRAWFGFFLPSRLGLAPFVISDDTRRHTRHHIHHHHPRSHRLNHNHGWHKLSFHFTHRFFGYKFALYPASGVADLTAVDAAVSAMELQVKAIKDRLREEAQAITKTKARSSHALSLFVVLNEWVLLVLFHSLFPEFSGQDSGSFEALRLDEEPAAVPKEEKGRGSPPTWHVTGTELDSLSS
ncbi:hypothetical protein JHK87_006051 [Glycine soja]|nr:hypothetical protein JHK87_006051 [Glycine soja]